MTAGKPSESMPNTSSLGFWVFVVVCAYFGFALYMLVPSALFASELISHYALYQELIKVPWWLVLFYASELGGGVGGALRVVAGFFALYSAVLFWRSHKHRCNCSWNRIILILPQICKMRVGFG
jgi:hypothetical protein